MAAINIINLTFSYEGSFDNIFENVTFTIDTNWKLGFIGRNGKGKTTFLNLLLGNLEYKGKIQANTSFDYFPYKVTNPSMNSYKIAEEIDNNYERWKLEYETSLLDINASILERPFNTLSKGEQTKVLLAILFTKENNFLLIDEPTNHLDVKARESVANYLKKKKGFILVSHDRKFLDSIVDHILSINRSNIEIQQGNFSTWWENKKRQDNYEINENKKLKKDINKLEVSAKQTTEWSSKIEESKNNIKKDLIQDKGYIGHKAAKMAKRTISAQNRIQKNTERKENLLKNIETIEDLKISPLSNTKKRLIEINNLSIKYNDNKIFDNISFYLEDGDRLQLKGKNGCGKSSLIKLLLGEQIDYDGNYYISNNLKISYISQDTSYLKGNLKNFILQNNIDETLFKSILRKLDFSRDQLNKNIESFSEGQKKKVLLAKSLCEEANIYIWDEPLNYIDIFSRIQIEELIKNYKPTMIFVEHDETFSRKIATKEIIIKRAQ